MRARRTSLLTRVLAGVGAAVLLSVAVLTSSPPVAAEANSLDGLPTWEEVQAAKGDTAAVAAKAREIEGLIAASEVELERLRNEHASAVTAFQQAEEEFMAAAQKAATLEGEAEQSRVVADAAAEQAAALVSQMYRSGGVDRNLELFLEADGDAADQLLVRLAAMSKATERNTAISDEAEQAMNDASSLGEQAEVARAEREQLREEKEQLQQEAAVAVASQAEAERSAPDGYTLLMGTPGPLAINPYIYENMAFDPAKDFAAVSYVADVPNVIVANPGTNIKNIEELIERAKAQPGQLNWGSPGIGSTGHLQLELLKQMTGVDIVHVPYKGSAAVTNDLIAGHIDLAGDNVPTALANIRAGKVKALAIAGEQSLEVLPGVPAAADTVSGYRMPSWFVLVAPAGTPESVTKKIAMAVDNFEKQPETIEKFRALGAVPVGGSPDRLEDHLKAEQERFGNLLKQMKSTKK